MGADVSSVAEPTNMMLLRANGEQSSRTTRLLSREELAEVWGLGGWSLTAAFHKSSPCSQRIVTSTALPASPQTNPQMVSNCGDVRWCAACASWYRALTECPPPRAWAILGDLLPRGAHGGATSGIRDLTALRGAACHRCDGQGRCLP